MKERDSLVSTLPKLVIFYSEFLNILLKHVSSNIVTQQYWCACLECAPENEPIKDRNVYSL